MKKKFSNIIDYDYKGSLKRERMPVNIRAKIFMPFSALNGFEEKIQNTRCDVEKSFDNFDNNVFDNNVDSE